MTDPTASYRPRHDSDGSVSDAPSSLRLTGAARRMQVLVETNTLLALLGFGERSFEDYDDLVASVSSMGVALYEKLFQFHLDDVVRVPQTGDDYVHNAQLVVNALGGALLDEQFDTEQLTGASLCDGDVASIQQLIRMFQHIYEILYASESSGVGRAERERRGEEAPAEFSREEDAFVETTPPKRASATTRKKTTEKMQKKEAPKTTRSGSRAAPSGVRHRRVAPMTTRRQTSAAARTRSNTPAQPTAIKKRTRRVDQVVQKTNRGNKQVQQIHQDEELEQELLTTQRYGRYVPVPQRSTRHMDDPLKGEDGEDFGSSGIELNQNDLVAGETYFGGVSSVSGASGSEASIHFMEEEGEFAKNFSAIQSHSSPGTNSKDSPETDSTPDRSGRVVESISRKSKNQEEADDDGDNTPRQLADDDEGTTSPVKKKVATAKTKISPTKPDRARGVPKTEAQQPTKASLYPLIPETKRHDHASKAHKEYLRYKIQLKDHLQELRQREYCQRQHLERAYRLGEHAANVERIRARRFEQELRLHRISIGLEAKNQEEKQLKEAMEHMLHLEKEKLRDEHRTTAKALQQIQRDHAEREQALETFYATQIQLVKEQTRRELEERETVEKAHRMASEQMIREMRRDRERELTSLLKEKQHLAEVRRFRHATQLTQAIEKGTEISARQGDAFYAAAMKARQLRANGSTSQTTGGGGNSLQKGSKAATASRQQVAKTTKAIYTARGVNSRMAVRV